MNLRLGILIGFGWLTSSLLTVAQTITERYDLKFQCTDAGRSPWIDEAYHCRFAPDTTILRNEKNPLKITLEPLPFQKRGMSFKLNQFIGLSEPVKGKEYRITLDYKAQQIKKITFIASLFNSDENKIVSDTLVLGNSDDWSEQTLTLPWNAKAKAIKIYLEYAYNLHPEQAVWLAGVTLRLDEENIGRRTWNGHSVKDSVQLLKSFDLHSVYSLSVEGEGGFPFDKIPDFEKKKVVALGSFSLGSEEAVRAMFQCARALVTHHKATRILVEWPFDLSMAYDLYVQGLQPAGFESNIRESLNVTGWDTGMCLEFLNWVREYNRTADRKVHLLGVDVLALPFSNSFLYEYFQTLLGEEKGGFYLDLIRKKRYKKLIEHVMQNDQELINLAGEDNYPFLSYFSGNYSDFTLDFAGYSVQEVNREREIINHYLNLLRNLKDQEKCVILGHHKHVARNLGSPWGGMLTSGLFLNYDKKEKKCTEYYAISFQAGSGSVRQQDCANSGQTYVKPLPPAPYKSFESIALAAGPDYFYYPTQYLNDGILQLLSLPTYSDPPYGYIFASPRQWFDAIVFIKESTPSRVSPDQPAKAKAYLEKRSRPVADQ